MDLRKYARGKPCMIRVPGVCNGNPETTVLCHLGGGGMGMKQPDIFGAWGCSGCHDAVDFRVITRNPVIPSYQVKKYHLEAVIRTQQELLKAGLGEVIEQWAKTLPKN